MQLTVTCKCKFKRSSAPTSDLCKHRHTGVVHKHTVNEGRHHIHKNKSSKRVTRECIHLEYIHKGMTITNGIIEYTEKYIRKMEPSYIIVISGYCNSLTVPQQLTDL